MKRAGRPFLFQVIAVLVSLLFLTPYAQALPVKHIIQFGGTVGFHYSPDVLDVLIGDTIVWQGDFTAYDLVSISVPSGAAPFGPIRTGSSFSYVVQIAGDYAYKNSIYFSIGMKGSFHAFDVHNGLSNEGREFYLAMIFPNYNSGTMPFFFTYAMINTYYENEINISYYDDFGNELPPRLYRVPSRGSLKVPLNRDAMRINETLDMPQAKSCHITSKRPITVEYLSVGPCSGGSYLALPIVGLGKKYVAASFNDNDRDGAISNSNFSGGAFIVVGTENGTLVQITPATTSTNGHTGAIHGVGSSHTPIPYNISLNKGQTYLVKSSGDDNENDMSGSIIEATKPIAVIAGHENAAFGLGGTDPFLLEGRDYMVEQMIPYELWDTAGYISIPLAEAQSPSDVGHGDTYRIYSFENNFTDQVHLSIGSGGENQSVSRFNFAEKKEIADPTEIYSLGGRKISVIQYDERSESKLRPWPAPSMMNVVPKSRWKRFYSFNILDNGSVFSIIDLPYVNIISDHPNDILFSANGGIPTSLSSLPKVLSYTNLSGSDGALKGTQYKLNTVPLSPPAPYYFTSQFPFMLYFYELRVVAPTGLGSNLPPNVPHEYATSAGMQLNTGESTTLLYTIDSTANCSGWHICVHDTATIDPGIRAVMLLDDPDGIYFFPGGKLQNANLDTTSVGYENGEYHPHVGTGENFCFDVNIIDPLSAGSAPVAIIDNKGNAVYFRLNYIAPSLLLATDPPTTSRADSIVFPLKAIGQEICTTFVIKNTAIAGGLSIIIESANLRTPNAAFVIPPAAKPFPHTIAPQEFDTLKVCYTPQDTLRHRDSVLIRTDCFSFSISLDAHGATGLILAEDADFGYVAVGKEYCKNMLVRNVGNGPFKILSIKRSDTADFAISAATLAQLPLTIPPNGHVFINVCFHPKQEGPLSESLTFGTDLGGSFATSIKNYSYISGTGAMITGVRYNAEPQTNFLKLNPNPANGHSVVATYPYPLRKKSVLSITDVLGREFHKKDILISTLQTEIPIMNLPEGIYFVVLSSEDGVISQKLQVVR